MASLTVSDVMTRDPITVDAGKPFLEAACAMRDNDIGPVIVTDKGSICGILTDRDIVVRGIAEGKDPKMTPAGELCSRELTSLSPRDSIDKAVMLMRSKAVRRVPVIDQGKPVGIVSLGDLAQEKDPSSALADISEAPPNS